MIEALGIVFASVGILEDYLEHAAMLLRYLYRVPDVVSDNSFIKLANQVSRMWFP